MIPEILRDSSKWYIECSMCSKSFSLNYTCHKIYRRTWISICTSQLNHTQNNISILSGEATSTSSPSFWLRLAATSPSLLCEKTDRPRKSNHVPVVLHPGRLTWNLQITHLERKMIFQTSMIMVHVNLPGCMRNSCSVWFWWFGQAELAHLKPFQIVGCPEDSTISKLEIDESRKWEVTPLPKKNGRFTTFSEN